ncbi:right-handed parallel beta-helix repeat-containing protein [Clostridium psychrophilum]|uniref:right-handed parallel beta-helix repeat-containing protein n=1 Tax=Clostridium psychrophilum TaxID=132926 RepID=UPI001C0AC801|nr:right-handed parallel beta-helix repeat-containing protein [Clostridium psychrophilum]MBU3179837.1 right-handed parallel beta-helix repeat-containing protein [Clostridium psychrophilum]
MLKKNIYIKVTTIIMLVSLSSVSPFATTTKAVGLAPSSSVTSVDTTSPTLIDAGTYNLDTTGATDTSVQFQSMINSFPSGSSIQLPKGTYKLSNIVKLKDNMTIDASNDVIIKGIGNNTLFSAGNFNSFQGIEFQNCATALSVFQKTGVNVVNCRFTNNIDYAAINFYGGVNCSVTNSYFSGIHKYGVLIDDDSSDITIDNNSFDNATVFGGYSSEQVGGHVYCLNGTRITVSNNIIKNSGGQGIIFGYNSTTGKGTTSSIASNNQCVGNGQEGVTIYGGSKKVTCGNSVIGNTSINNRFNQIEVWQSDNNTVRSNTVEESIFGRGSLGAICLFATTGTTCTSNNVLSSQTNGIAIIAGTTHTTVSDNFIADTNRSDDINKAEKGNGILLDWNGVADPAYITIENNKISSSNGIIAKSAVYSTSNVNHHNTIDSNLVTGYKYGVHWYALATCGI